MVLHYYCVLCLEGLVCAFTPLYCFNFDILLVNHFAKLFILFPNSKLPLRCRARAISSQHGLISTESDVPNKQTIVPWKVNAKGERNNLLRKLQRFLWFRAICTRSKRFNPASPALSARRAKESLACDCLGHYVFIGNYSSAQPVM